MSCLKKLTELIKNSLDDKTFGCGIFLDLQKAFDTVNQKMLLEKNKHYGIRGTQLCHGFVPILIIEVSAYH